MKPLVFLTIFLLSSSLLIGADYLEMFGTRTSSQFDFVTATFKIRDAETGAPIFGSRVKCQQKGNDNVCTLKDTSLTDILSLLFPRYIEYTRTLLFKKKEKILPPSYPDVHIFFIHPNYQTVNVTVPILDILEENFPQKRIEMDHR